MYGFIEGEEYMKKYCVDIYYNCSAHYVVEAKDKEEAYERLLK